jgi:putative ABC transport system permease protein
MTKRGWFIHFLRRSLGQRKGRVAVASASVMLAAGVVVAAMGVSLGIGDKLGDELKAYGANVIVTPVRERFLEQNVVDVVRAQQGVDDATGQLYAAASVQGAEVEIIGLDMQGIKGRGWKLQGEWPEEGEVLAGSDIGQALSLAPGGTVSLAWSEMPVSGLIERGGPEDSSLMLHLADAQRLTSNEGKISSVLVRASTDNIEATVAALTGMLPDVQVKTLRQVARAEESFLGKIELLMLLVTLVVLIASSICVSSTMSATVLERLEEIGLMKAIGGTKREIRRFFLAEGVFIGVVGGLLGYALGFASAQAVSKGAFGSYISVPPYIVLVSLGMGLLISVASSMLPVSDAIKKRASDIFRGE